MRVLVLHNRDFDDDASGEPTVGIEARADVEVVAHAAAAALNGRAEARVAGARNSTEVRQAVGAFRPEVVVNLCESLHGDARYEPCVAALLERLQVAYTGCPPAALRSCLDKAGSTALLARAGVPVPRSWLVVDPERLPSTDELVYPLIVKPNREDGSTGIFPDSVAHDRLGLKRAVRRLADELGGAAVIQRYIEGREVNVGLLGAAPMRVLPLAEIDFGAMPAGQPRIVSYAAKWAPESSEWHGTRVVAGRFPPRVAHALRRVAAAAARALDLAGYARVDLRVDAAGRPFVVDVNPNCDLGPDAGLARAAARAGFRYPELVWTIVCAALRRRGAG